MSLQLVANHLAQKGRGPDSTLVHMSNREVAGLQALAKKHGGSLTTNPDTGLPEAGFLDSLLPTIAGGALTYFSGGAINPLMAAGIVGGISALDSKDLGKGLMAGLGAYGGGSMVGGLAGMGLAEGAATATTPASEAAMQAAIKDNTYKTAVGTGASNFGSMFANKPMETIASFGGGSGLNATRNIFAAAAPAIMADQNVKTTTPTPERGKIRPYTFNAQQMNPSQTGPVSGERRYFNNEFTAGDPYSAANGGLVALARGGYAQQPLFKPTAPLPTNNMYGASRDAYDYLMGVNPTGGQPYDPNRPFPPGMQPSIPEQGMQPDPNKPKKGHYEYDPITGQYKFIPDPIKPVEVAPPVFENPAQRGGGGPSAEQRQADLNAPNPYWRNGLTQSQYFDMSPEDRAVVDAQAKIDHPILSSIGDFAKMALIPGGFVFGAIKDAYNKLNPPPPVPPASDMTYPSDQAVTYDGSQPVNTELQKVIEGQPSIYDKGLMGVNTTPRTEATTWTDASGNTWQTGDKSPLMTGYGASILGQQETDRRVASSESMGDTTGKATTEGLAALRAATDKADAAQKQESENREPGDRFAPVLAPAPGYTSSQFSAAPVPAPAETSTVPTVGFFNSILGQPTQLAAGVGFNPFTSTTESATETAPAANPVSVDPAQAGIAALAQAQAQADREQAGREAARQAEAQAQAAAQAQADREQAGREAARQAEAQAAAQAAAQAQADREQAGREAARQAEAQARAQAAQQASEGGPGYTSGGGGRSNDGGGYSGAPSGGDGVGRSAPGSAHEGAGGYGGGGDGGGGGGDARGGYYHHGQFNYHPYAHGGIAALGNQYNLGSYSDGGRLLKGPGDGVSDDIPATIGHGQPARLADGEFVIPARIVSELGNGSTDAGARELYKMMDRIQAGRRKTVGKDQVAKNSKAARHLPA